MSSVIDLTKGIHIQVEGETGKYNTLPVEDLVRMAQSLQRLVQVIAKSNIDTGEAIDLDNFKIELAGFQPGSAIPEWVVTPRVQLHIADLDAQMEVVNTEFERVMDIAARGHYTDLRKFYPDAIRRNDVVDAVFDFRNSVKDAPMALVKMPKRGRPKKLFALKPFKKETKQALTTKVVEAPIEGEAGFAVARLRVLKDGKGKVIKKKILDTYPQAKSAIAWAPEVIVHDERVYVLRHALPCIVEHEDKVFSIENPLLGIMGTGSDMDEAERSFMQEFDFIHRRYTMLPDKKLAAHLLPVKRLLKHLVKEIDG
jgi:hypothetical protein